MQPLTQIQIMISAQSTGTNGIGIDRLGCDLQGLKQGIQTCCLWRNRPKREKGKKKKLTLSLVTPITQKDQEKESFCLVYIYTWRVGAFGASFRLLWRGENRWGHLVWPAGSTAVILADAKNVAAASSRRSQNPVSTQPWYYSINMIHETSNTKPVHQPA